MGRCNRNTKSCIQKSQITAGVNLAILCCSSVLYMSHFLHFSLEASIASDGLSKHIFICSLFSADLAEQSQQDCSRKTERLPQCVNHSQMNRKFIMFSVVGV